MTDAILELESISKRFGATVTADRLTLSIGKGEFFTFLGPSGSGKSTILRIIAGLDRPDAGRVLIAGRDMADVAPWDRNLGMVFQQYALFPHMTVAENVGYGLKLRKLPAADVTSRADEMLRLVGLEGMQGKNATLLSGGEQQRVALARALVLQPSLLLLDEPLSALDEKIRREMQTELKHIQKQTGTTFLYVTHDQEEALTMSDRIAVLNRGICVQCDAPEALFRRPRTRFVAKFFRGCNVLEADLGRSPTGAAMVRLGGVALELDGAGPPPAAAGRPAIAIRAENLRLGAAARDCELHFPAVFGEAIYRGTNVDHMLRLADGQQVTATSARRELSQPEEATEVGVNRADVILLQD
jgi:ABC-type Fe3+/spermidine/putrescine transport system ATPase subunit